MPSSASRRTDRAAAATGALLLQLGFIAAFLHAFSAQTPPQQFQRELIFFLPRLLPKPVPVKTGPAPRATAAPSPFPLFAPPPTTLAAPPSNAPILQNLGRSLFGCAPENYTSLTPRQRTLCPPPGDGAAIQNAPNPMNTPSHTKDEAYWKEELRQKQAPKLLFGLGGAYAADRPMSNEETRVQEMTTWDPCPPIANTPCLYNIGRGYPQPGAAGAPPSIKGVTLHPQ